MSKLNPPTRSRLAKAAVALAAVAAAGLAVSACVVSIDSDRAPAARQEVSNRPVQCDASRYQSLIGQEASTIDRATLPKEFRIVCAGCPMTMDYREDRLTLVLDKANRVSSASCT